MSVLHNSGNMMKYDEIFVLVYHSLLGYYDRGCLHEFAFFSFLLFPMQDGLVDFYKHLSHSSLDDSALTNGVWSGKQLVGVATLGILTVGAFFFRS